MNNEQQKQYEQDVADYGDGAYLMWDESFGVINTFDFNMTPDDAPHPRRKESAALLFDTERERAGDAVEWLNNNGKWEYIPQNDLVYLHGQEARLRMKYPKKISTEKTEYCTYPECPCPFNAPLDPNWCAIGLSHKPK